MSAGFYGRHMRRTKSEQVFGLCVERSTEPIFTLSFAVLLSFARTTVRVRNVACSATETQLLYIKACLLNGALFSESLLF